TQTVATLTPTSGHYLEKQIPSAASFELVVKDEDLIITFKNQHKKLPIILNGIEISEMLSR
ncbi:MAG: hypothetical protein AAF573_21065, partial [Bacteroidota bacterium]